MSMLIGSSNKPNTLLSAGSQHTIDNKHKSTLLIQESAHVCEVEECKEGELRIENCLSEFQTEEQKAAALRNLGIESIAKWGKIQGYIEDQKDLQELLKTKIDDTLTVKVDEINKTLIELKDTVDVDLTKKVDKEEALQQIKYTNDAYPNIQNLEDAFNELLYFDLKTLSFKTTPADALYGETITSIKYEWSYNKPIKEQNFIANNKTISLPVNEFQYTLNNINLTNNLTAKLSVKDSKKDFVFTNTFSFKYLFFIGNATDITADNIKSKLQSSRISAIPTGSLSIKCGNTEHGFVGIPKKLITDPNKVKFIINNNQYGWEFFILNIRIVDNYYLDYYVFKNANPGQTFSFNIAII